MNEMRHVNAAIVPCGPWTFRAGTQGAVFGLGRFRADGSLSPTQFDVAGAALGRWERNRLLLELSPQAKTSCDPQLSSTSPHFLPRTTLSAIMNISTCTILSALALGCHAQAEARTEAKITLVESDTLYHTLPRIPRRVFQKCTIDPNANLHFAGHLPPDNPRNSRSLQLFFSSRRRPFEKPNQHCQRRLCAPGRLLVHRIWQLAGQPSGRARRQSLHPVRHSLGRLRQTSNSNPRPLARPRWRQRPMDATPARPRLRHLLLPPQTPASR